MKGVPFRIEIGERELNSGEVSVFIRDTKEKILVKLENIVEEIKNLGAEFDSRLILKADKFFNEKIVNCLSKISIKKALNSGKIARFVFCSVDKNGQKCAEFIEKDLSARVMGTRADLNEDVVGDCLFCGEKANFIVYAGKSY
jgi:prolyl-tRNA synthetase